MAYFTHSFTAANGVVWPDFTRVSGASLDVAIQSNTGWNGTVAAERYYQSDFWPGSDSYKWSVLADWVDAITVGRYFGMAARLTDDGNTCYWWKISGYRISDTTLNMPHAILYRRRSGSDTQIVAETDISATISGADLNAGVTFQMRIENTDADTVNIKLLADDGGGMTELISYDDTNAARIQSGGTIGIITGSTSVNGDIAYDDVSCDDFGDEAAGGAPATTGVALSVNGTHYDEDGIVTLGIGGLRARRSYGVAPEGTIRDLNDFHLPILKPGDDVSIRYNDAYYASGVIRPVTQEGVVPEANTFEIHGAKMLSQGVVISHPTSNQGQVIFNDDSESPEYDSTLDSMSPGDIIAWIFDNHMEGEDGLRAHKAAPPSGTAYTIPAGLTSGPNIPGITISGTVAEAIETALSYMPQYAWRVDPETKHHYFDDRDAASATDIDAADDHVFVRLETRPSQNKTGVLIRGGKPEVTPGELSLADGDLVGMWDANLEATHTAAKANVNRVEGTIAAYGAYVADPTYGNRIYIDPVQTAGIFAMDADQWNDTYLYVVMTTHGAKTFKVYKNTASRIILTSTAWPSGGAHTPTVGDSIAVFGNRNTQSTVEGDSSDGKNNAYFDMYRTYGPTVGTFAQGDCFTATGKVPTNSDEDAFAIPPSLGGRVINGVFVLDQPALLPVGLVNYLPGRDGGCGVGQAQGLGQGGLGDITMNIPTANTTVPLVRVPTTGFRGTAYAPAAKWDGAGEAGYGDPGVRDLLVIDDPNFQYQAVQQADYIAMADALLKVYGTLSVAAQISLVDAIDPAWLGLDIKATISDTTTPSRTTGYESSTDLWLAEVEYDFEAWSTTLRFGSISSFGGVNVQAVRQRYVENQRIKSYRKMVKRAAEIMNCMKEGNKQATAAGIPASTQICASSVVTSSGGTVEDSVDHEVVSDSTTGVDAALCPGNTCSLVSNDSAFVANAADAIAKGPSLSQPTNRGAVSGNWIEVSVACNQEHINALWGALYTVTSSAEAAFDVVKGCFTNLETDISALDTNIQCIIDYINNTLIPTYDACFMNKEDCIPEDSCTGCIPVALSCDPFTGSTCGAICECAVAIPVVVCNA